MRVLEWDVSVRRAWGNQAWIGWMCVGEGGDAGKGEMPGKGENDEPMPIRDPTHL
jgi:hypothetical protein